MNVPDGPSAGSVFERKVPPILDIRSRLDQQLRKQLAEGRRAPGGGAVVATGEIDLDAFFSDL
jgi:hypothetical protein